MRLPGVHSQLEQLIAISSVSSTIAKHDQSNLPVVELLANWLTDLGFVAELLPIPGNPGKANLIATLGQGPGGLVLSGHTDTVPFDEHLWSSDPLKLTEKDGRFYGLGSSDMKGFFPLAIQASKPFLQKRLKQPLIILATADEESSMSGARALQEAGTLQAQQAIIGEPTALKPIRMQKGMMMQSITLEGQSGHSSDPGLGNNAIEAMQKVLAELISLKHELSNKYHNPLFQIPYPTLNFGSLHGGDNPNRICGHCELQIDLRPLPGMDLDELRGLLQQRLQPLADQQQISLSIKSLFCGIPAHETPAGAPIVKMVEKLTGYTAGAVNFATEAPFLGKMGVDTVVWGPGDIEQAHQPNESLSIDRIAPTISTLEQLINTFCV